MFLVTQAGLIVRLARVKNKCQLYEKISHDDRLGLYMDYEFQDFELKTNQRLLIKHGREIQMPGKIYMFLLVLLENAGSVVSRKTLEEVVWKGRIVTDATIYQLVARLRNVLDDYDEDKPIIQTVHGEGYRLMPAVTSVSEDQPGIPASRKSKLRPKGLLYSLIVIMLIAFFWLDNANKNDKEQQQTITSAQILPLRISFIPANLASHKTSDASTEWLFSGGMFYLAELLSRNTPLITQPPRKQWLEAENKSSLAIELLQDKKTDVVLLVDAGKDGDTYFSTVQIRDIDGVGSSKEFRSSSIRQLMAQVSVWVQERLQPSATGSDVITMDLSKDEFAIESFIRGMAAQLQGDAKKAIKFFQLSVEQDPDFLKAWYELGVAQRKQGNYERALSIFSILLQNPNSLTGQAANAAGITYWRQGEYKLADAAFKQALENARELNSRHSIRSILTNMAILSMVLEDYDSARKSLDEAITLIDPENDPYSYGAVMNNYAGLESRINNNKEAIAYSEAAIDAFARAGELRYKNTAKSRLSGILIALGRFSEGESLALQTLEFRRQSEDRSGMVASYNTLARVAVITGRFRDSENYWNKSLQLLIELGGSHDQGKIYASLADLYLRSGSPAEASVQIELLQDIAVAIDSEVLRTRHLGLTLRLALAQGELQQAQEILTKMASGSSAEAALYKGDLLQIGGSSEAAEAAYLEAASILDGSGKNLAQAEIQNRLTSLYLEIDINKAQDSIDKTQQYSPFPYPLLKYQAIVSYRQGQHFKAVSQLEQLKASANEFWQPEDQLLLEKFSKKL